MKRKALQEIKLKSRCPYCHRVETFRLGWNSLITIYTGYVYEDIQCGMCGSKYDVAFSFEALTKRHSNARKKGILPRRK